MIEGLFGLYLIYLVAVLAIGSALPTILLVAGGVIGFLFELVLLVLSGAFVGSVMVVVKACSWFCGAASKVSVFAAFVIIEALETLGLKKRSFEDEFGEDWADDLDEDEDDPVDVFALACARLGLAGEFTKEEFKKAYRKAYAAAHPDRGGSTEEAQEVGAAREAIAVYMGWAV